MRAGRQKTDAGSAATPSLAINSLSSVSHWTRPRRRSGILFRNNSSDRFHEMWTLLIWLKLSATYLIYDKSIDDDYVCIHTHDDT